VARQVALIISALLLAAATLVSGAEADKLKTPQVPWTSLSPDERRVLEPVAPEWPRMPGYQQERLKGAARKYQTMQPIQKERFETRVRDWATMSPDQRKAARETFQGLRKLPTEKQHELRERWLERHAAEAQGRPPQYRESQGGQPQYREFQGGPPHRETQGRQPPPPRESDRGRAPTSPTAR
jgi:hypothetical protein